RPSRMVPAWQASTTLAKETDPITGRSMSLVERALPWATEPNTRATEIAAWSGPSSSRRTSGRLPEDAGQFLMDGAVPIRLITHLIPGGGSQEQSDFIQELEFAMQGPRRDASEPGDLTHIEGFVGTKQQQSEDLP